MYSSKVLGILIVALAVYGETSPEWTFKDLRQNQVGAYNKYKYIVEDKKASDHTKGRREGEADDPDDSKIENMGSYAEISFFPHAVRTGRSRFVTNMIDPKRHPKPKLPVGNDLGIARVLKPHSNFHPEPDRLINTNKNGNEETTKTPEEKADEKIKMIEDSLPKLPEIHLPHAQIEEDPEEKAINERITMVARQLAEFEARKNSEREKLGNVFPISEKLITPKISPKSLEYPSIHLPLVSQLPQEISHLQMISEVPRLLHILTQEGFHPVTLSPELSGPLLGGPPLPEEMDKESLSPTSEARKGRDVYHNWPVVAYLQKVPYNMLLNVPWNKE